MIRDFACRLRHGLILLVLFSLAACSDPELTPLEHDAVVLAFGDSLVEGLGVAPEYAFPQVLQQRLNAGGDERVVVNAGVSGETTAEGLARLPDLLEDTRPDLLILLEGGNDILQNLDLGKTETNLDAMISLAQQRGIEVVLVGVPQKSLLSKTAPFYRVLAENRQVPLHDDVIGTLLRKPSMKSDAVHFNRTGYEALADAVHELLGDAGAV